MKSKLKFALRQSMKMVLQNVILPCVYGFWSLVYCRKEPDLIIFADAHHEKLPASMQVIRERLVKKGYSVTEEIHNFAKISTVQSVLVSLRFMKLYARAKYVFICDNFLPVVSCRKSEKTKVIQLWHCCGLMKKMGYDTTEDIPAGYKGAVYRNYDLMTVSSPNCVEPLTKAMRLPDGILQPLGVSRTDLYFSEAWRQKCRDDFYTQYPQAVGKTIVLWAPTFRGNATDPYQVGMEAILQLEKTLGEEYYLIRKVHPHVDDRYHLSNCSIVTEQLLPVADLLITDYSTVMTEYLFFNKPYVLFAPDLAEYQCKRGFYIDYKWLSPYVVTEENALQAAVVAALADRELSWIHEIRAFQLGACDGKSTDRILDHIGL